jgi:hypothetical protein
MLFDDTTLRRFWAKVNKTGPLWNGTPCWLWTARCDTGGYGRFRVDGKDSPAHRIAYILCIEEIPVGLELDHLCRVHPCVNPIHLEAVTHQENTQRGNAGAYLAARTHCLRGHPYSPENTYYARSRLNRMCRICRRNQQRLRNNIDPSRFRV